MLPNCMCMPVRSLGRFTQAIQEEGDSLLGIYLRIYNENGLLMQYDDRLDFCYPDTGYPRPWRRIWWNVIA